LWVLREPARQKMVQIRVIVKSWLAQAFRPG
jgi:hypothetical protein